MASESDGAIGVDSQTQEIPPRNRSRAFSSTRGETITHERARDAAMRLIHSHFGTRPFAKISIPVNADDDDVVIHEYISQQIEKEMGFREPQLKKP